MVDVTDKSSFIRHLHPSRLPERTHLLALNGTATGPTMRCGKHARVRSIRVRCARRISVLPGREAFRFPRLLMRFEVLNDKCRISEQFLPRSKD
jgi:hypothetical protein